MEEKIDAKWYAENYTPWIDDINSYEDLEKFWANLNPRYKRRFDHWFKNIELKGNILECGFNNGKTLKWINDKYNLINLYGIDFNPSLKKIVPFLKSDIKNIEGLAISDINLPQWQFYEHKYDHIICLDFIEHLYLGDYLLMIDYLYDDLFPQGRIYVFAGYAKLKEHVNILSLEEIREDFIGAGFKFIIKIAEPGTGDTMQIFEK